MPHAENSCEVTIDPALGELGGAALHWLKLRLIVPANLQLPLQRTMYDRNVTITTLHTSPIHGTAFLNPTEIYYIPGRQITCVITT